jgi:hypothetical protein
MHSASYVCTSELLSEFARCAQYCGSFTKQHTDYSEAVEAHCLLCGDVYQLLPGQLRLCQLRLACDVYCPKVPAWAPPPLSPWAAYGAAWSGAGVAVLLLLLLLLLMILRPCCHCQRPVHKQYSECKVAAGVTRLSVCYCGLAFACIALQSIVQRASSHALQTVLNITVLR